MFFDKIILFSKTSLLYRVDSIVCLDGFEGITVAPSGNVAFNVKSIVLLGTVISQSFVVGSIVQVKSWLFVVNLTLKIVR